MKIIFTGGGSGGHFYPVIAIAEAIQKIVKEKTAGTRNVFLLLLHTIRDFYMTTILNIKSDCGQNTQIFSLMNF